MEAIRIIYGPDLVPIFSHNIEIVSNVPEAKEVVFNLVFNKKHKKKSKATSFPSMFLLTLRARYYLFYRLFLFSKLEQLVLVQP